MYQLLKLNHRKDASVEKDNAAVEELKVLQGHSLEPITIGRCFRFATMEGLLITSVVKSIYVHETEADKLVLPSEFDYTEDITSVDMKEGDVMFATNNSVYLLRRVNEDAQGEERILPVPNVAVDPCEGQRV